MVYIRINTAEQFANEYKENAPEYRKNSFSYEGLIAIYNYLEEQEIDYQFRPVDIDIQFTEYDSIETATQDGINVDDDYIIKFSNGIIILN